MRRWLVGSLALVSLGIGSVAVEAIGPNLGLRRCTETTVVSDTDTSVGVTNTTTLTSGPAIVCSVDFVAVGTNGFAEVFDSPDNTLTHAQKRTVAEVGAATAANGDHADYAAGRLTYYGLAVHVQNGHATISWDD